MIGSLQGTVQDLELDSALLLTAGGVGYRLRLSRRLAESWSLGQEVTCLTELVVREDELSLYGLADETERQLFTKLLTVSGVGPKVALAFLTIPAPTLQQAIETEDLSVLTSVSGVGKKLAQKLILELRGKLVWTAQDELSSPNSPHQEALEALEGLGYQRATIQALLQEASAEYDTAEKLIKFYLSHQNQPR